MTEERIPFSTQQASGLEELGGASPLAMNVVMMANGVLRRRPGIGPHPNTSSAVVDANGLSGIYITLDDAMYAVGAVGAERPIYQVGSLSSSLLGGGVPPTGLRGTRRPVFAETEMLLVIAGGAEMQKIQLASSTSSRLGGTPPVASHVVAQASRLLANDLVTQPTRIFASNTFSGKTTFAGAENWTIGTGSNAGFFTAEAQPDPVIALAENTNELFVPGTRTLQVFDPDPDLLYVPVTTREVGSGAAYSFIKKDQVFYWLDNLRRFVRSDGRTFEVISDPIKTTLDGLTTVSDCFGFRSTWNFLDVMVWVFPTDGRTFVYQENFGWSEWAGWDDASNNWTLFPVTAHATHTIEGHSVVAHSSGKVGMLDFTQSTDYGTRIVAFVQTGYANHGTDAVKQCVAVRLALRRGQGSATPGPSGFLKFRDRPWGGWDATIPVDFGSSGDTEIVLQLRGLGAYRRRQWAFEFSDPSDLTLVSAIEEFEVMDL